MFQIELPFWFKLSTENASSKMAMNRLKTIKLATNVINRKNGMHVWGSARNIQSHRGSTHSPHRTRKTYGGKRYAWTILRNRIPLENWKWNQWSSTLVVDPCPFRPGAPNSCTFPNKVVCLLFKVELRLHMRIMRTNNSEDVENNKEHNSEITDVHDRLGNDRKKTAHRAPHLGESKDTQ